MRNKGPRFWRKLRIGVKRVLRRLDRRTPEWMRWLTPLGTSLSLHTLGLLTLGVLFLSNSAGPHRGKVVDAVWAGQLHDDITSLKPGDRAGDPFTTLASDEPPSLTLDPSKVNPDVSNLPALTPDMTLGADIQLEPPAAGQKRSSQSAKANGSGRPSPREGAGGDAGFTHGPEKTAPFAGRRADMRAKIVRREGGTVESEAAVEKGLDWLARHQKADGGWSLDTSGQCQKGSGCPLRPAMTSDTAATGLALLPFLASGQTHMEKGRYQDNIYKSLVWLVKHQAHDGKLFIGGEFNTGMYSHAIATMALCEAYGLTKDKRLRDPAQKAINYIVKSQNKEDGGWRYSPNAPGDTSVFGWVLFALRSASLAQLDVPKATIRKCRTYLDFVSTDPLQSTYGYLPGYPATPTMTAEGLLGRQYLGWAREHPSMLQGVSLVVGQLQASTDRNMYYWYYATQLLHNIQGKDWERWNYFIRETLVDSQVTGLNCDRGSWDSMLPAQDRWGLRAGRLYQTSLSLLTLEVYYRYLPLYQTERGSYAAERPPAANAELAEPAEKSKAARSGDRATK
jgi:hypothetical protein